MSETNKYSEYIQIYSASTPIGLIDWFFILLKIQVFYDELHGNENGVKKADLHAKSASF